MNIEIAILGTTPLLMHNPRMVDPEFPLNREIKALTSKRKKTDEDLRKIEDLEWYGGLYTEGSGKSEVVVQPTSKVRKCIINTGKISKQGKSIERAVILTELNVPLIYDGPQDIKSLSENHVYRSRLSVGIGNKRVMRCRPQFNPWGLIVRGYFVDDAGLNFDELCRIVALAGIAERIGDNRVNGYGRFRGVVRNLDSGKVKDIKPTIKGLEAFFEELDKATAG